MMKKTVISIAITTLFVASQVAFAVDEHHPEDEAVSAQAAPMEQPTISESGESSTAPGMMSMGGSTEQKSGSMMMGPSMGETGMMGTGMMRQMMMGGQQGADGQGGMMGPGMMRGCHSGMSQGGMMSRGMSGGGGMMQTRQQLMGRLDLLDARLAKIEAMLESLLQR